MSQLIQQQQQRYKISQVMRNCQLKQTKYVSYNVQENAYCFLGALGIEMSKRGFNTPEEMIGGKVPKSFLGNIIKLNHIEGLSFAEIADYVEKEYSL